MKKCHKEITVYLLADNMCKILHLETHTSISASYCTHTSASLASFCFFLAVLLYRDGLCESALLTFLISSMFFIKLAKKHKSLFGFFHLQLHFHNSG